MTTITVYTTNGEIIKDEDTRGIIDEIKAQYETDAVTNVCLDEEFGTLSADIDSLKYVAVGHIEDILKSIQWRAAQ